MCDLQQPRKLGASPSAAFGEVQSAAASVASVPAVSCFSFSPLPSAFDMTKITGPLSEIYQQES